MNKNESEVVFYFVNWLQIGWPEVNKHSCPVWEVIQTNMGGKYIVEVI